MDREKEKKGTLCSVPDFGLFFSLENVGWMREKGDTVRCPLFISPFYLANQWSFDLTRAAVGRVAMTLGFTSFTILRLSISMVAMISGR